MRGTLLLLLLAACASPASRTAASVEQDGSYTHVFEQRRDDVFHAAIAAAEALGYRVEVADPMAGRVSARSAVEERLGTRVEYDILRADVEAPQAGRDGVRLRVTLTHTHHRSGESRSSIDDTIVSGRAKYDAFFEEVARQLGG